MLKKFLVAILLAQPFTSLIAEQAFPMIRFWRGYTAKAKSTDQGRFYDLLNTKLIPETIRVGSQQQDPTVRGLLAYAPSALRWETAREHGLPEEMAVLVYQSEAHYDRIRATEDGAKYGPLHFEPGLFSKSRSDGKKSGSLVAKPYEGKVEMKSEPGVIGMIAQPAAYLLGTLPQDWQEGYALTRAIVPADGGRVKALKAKKRLTQFSSDDARTKIGLAYGIYLFDSDSIIEYLVFRTADQRRRALESGALARWDQDEGFTEVQTLSHESRPVDQAKLSSGVALNVRFNPNLDCKGEVESAKQ